MSWVRIEWGNGPRIQIESDKPYSGPLELMNLVMRLEEVLGRVREGLFNEKSLVVSNGDHAGSDGPPAGLEGVSRLGLASPGNCPCGCRL